jgi:hypothetical protein
MSTKLSRLLESIDPSRTLNKVSADVDRAVNSFATRRTTIKDWDEYKNFLADFFRHIESVVLRLGGGAPRNREIYWSRCSNILNNTFGPNGFKTAFEIIRTGKEGGLYRILKTIADQMAENYSQNEISARISKYWESLTPDEKIAAPDEFLKKHGNLLPAEYTAGSAASLRINFLRVLNEYPYMIRRLRQVGK